MDAPKGRELPSLERAAEVFSLLSAASRLRMLCALCEREMCVGELATAVEMPQPTVSQQLALMFRAGLVSRRRERSQVHYSVDPRTRDFLCEAVQALVV